MSQRVERLLEAIDEYIKVKATGGDTTAAAEAVRKVFNPAVFDAIDSYNDPYR